VELDVVDRNNKPPIWEQQSYGPVYVKENASQGQIVTTVRARFVTTLPSLPPTPLAPKTTNILGAFFPKKVAQKVTSWEECTATNTTYHFYILLTLLIYRTRLNFTNLSLL
jgi:hypothetical protein